MFDTTFLLFWTIYFLIFWFGVSFECKKKKLLFQFTIIDFYFNYFQTLLFNFEKNGFQNQTKNFVLFFDQ